MIGALTDGLHEMGIASFATRRTARIAGLVRRRCLVSNRDALFKFVVM